MARADPAARPGRGYEHGQPAAGASRTAKNRPAGLHGITSQMSSPGARIMGQNGRGPAKGAVIRTASFARTLYTICTYHCYASTRSDTPLIHGVTRRKRPAGPRFRSQRAVFAGGGRCWVRTNVG